MRIKMPQPRPIRPYIQEKDPRKRVIGPRIRSTMDYWLTEGTLDTIEYMLANLVRKGKIDRPTAWKVFCSFKLNLIEHVRRGDRIIPTEGAIFLVPPMDEMNKGYLAWLDTKEWDVQTESIVPWPAPANEDDILASLERDIIRDMFGTPDDFARVSQCITWAFQHDMRVIRLVRRIIIFPPEDRMIDEYGDAIIVIPLTRWMGERYQCEIKEFPIIDFQCPVDAESVIFLNP
jgi:hypothetical protein